MTFNKIPTPSKSKHNILIVDNDDDLGRTIQTQLTASGFKATRIGSFFGALAVIEEGGAEPVAVVIACHQLEKMSGDDLLKNVKEISPDTQRILLIESMEINPVVSGINRAGIHSCLTIPLNNELLVAEVSLRCDQFDQQKKRERLLKITRHQNKQLYQMALKLKQKKEKFEHQIKKKRTLLETMTKRKTRCRETKDGIDLQGVLDLKGVVPRPKPYATEFKSLAFKLKCFLEENAFEESVRLKRVKEILTHPQADSKTASWMDGKYTASTLQSAAPSPSSPREDAIISPSPLPVEAMRAHIFAREPWLNEAFVEGIFLLFLEHEYHLAKKLSKDFPNKTHHHDDDSPNPFVLDIASDHLTARIQYTAATEVDNTYEALQLIKAQIENEEITFGLVEDEAIEEWLTDLSGSSASMVIARGISPVFATPEKITYHFDVDYRQAGSIKSDGTIDFRERGRIPYVKAGTRIAEKKPLRPGMPGKDIFGNPMEVEQPEEASFAAGSNVRLSDDGLEMFATEEGQPFLDAMGVVSVYKELSIQGDVGYETGNIDFDGNLVVAGSIKEGFSVKCANLTANQIQGGSINVSGNLNISSGIVDSRIINVQGHIQAKYVNNSDIKVFGDIIIQREIIDSHIYSGGELQNENGSIFSSTIFAKKGIKAGSVGSDKSTPVSVEVGTDKLMQMIQKEIDTAIKENNHQLSQAENAMHQLEAMDRALLEEITDYAYRQEQLQDLSKQQGKAMEHPSQTKEQIQALEEKINNAFEEQERILRKVQRHQDEIKTLEKANKLKVIQKRALHQFAARIPSKSVMTVMRTVTAGTSIRGQESRLTLVKDESHCRIYEIAKTTEGSQMKSYEMVIASR